MANTKTDLADLQTTFTINDECLSHTHDNHAQMHQSNIEVRAFWHNIPKIKRALWDSNYSNFEEDTVNSSVPKRRRTDWTVAKQKGRKY